jgi:SAM-dependent MidA family methyltransferase
MTAGVALADRLAARIRLHGPVGYAELIDAALYDDHDGFYAQHGSAGRHGDFLTSPEVGPLFGSVVARALDTWWHELGEPARFRLIEAGAGRGTLARAVLAADPACRRALEYVLVERSARLRAEHPSDERVHSRADLPEDAAIGVVLANELLDNLPVDIVEWHDGAWHEVRVAVDGGGTLVEVLAPEPVAPTRVLPQPVSLPPGRDGQRLPLAGAAQSWLQRALGAVHGRVVVIDYARPTAALAELPWRDWLRTYRGHERGGHPFDELGTQDITCDVPVDQLAAVRTPDADRSQADFLRSHGIDQLVAEGRAVWHERAALGDLAALRARSRVREAEALLDPAGLGGFRVLEWTAS